MKSVLSAGDQFGDWVLKGRLGKGGVGEVWEARSLGDERSVAIKVARQDPNAPDNTEFLLAEGRLLKQLEHHGVPQFVASGHAPQPYVAMELLRGETLATRLQSADPLDPSSVIAIATSVLRTLDYLHNRGIIHRDVKASNIFLADDRRILLLDLGLAAGAGELLGTALGSVMGTYAYMAPEQIAGSMVDQRADLYSLGVTLYEALTGRRPFHARGAAGYLRAHREGHAQPVVSLCPDAPVRLLDTVVRLMARDPLARPSTASIALARLVGASGAERRLQPAPLVGRASAIGAIQAIIDAGGCLSLLGEIGSGVARLARLVIARTKDADIRMVALRCRPGMGASEMSERLQADLLRAGVDIGPNVQTWIKSMKTAVVNHSWMIVVERMEYAPPQFLDDLMALSRQVPRLGLVMTGFRGPLSHHGHVVHLRPITPEETRKLTGEMLGSDSPPAGLVGALHRLSGGLPAVAVMAIKDLVAKGGLWCEGITDDGAMQWRLEPNVAMAPTVGLRRLFGGVLERQTADANRMLAVLAVADQAVPEKLLLSICALSDATVVQDLLRSGLISLENHDDGTWVMFRRPALGSLIGAELSARHTTAIHQQLADGFASWTEAPWKEERIAWHRAHGVQSEEAPMAFLRLAERLLGRGQVERALSVINQAGRIHESEISVSASLAVLRGEALETSARRDEAVEAFRAGQLLAEEVQDEELIARSMVGLAQVHHGLGDQRRAAMMAGEALQILENRPEDPSLPRALLLAATSHRLGGRPDQAADTYARCIDVAAKQGREEFLAMARGGVGVLLADEGSLEQAVAYFSDETDFLRSQRMFPPLVATLYRLSVCRRRQGLPDLALEALDEAEDVARFADLPFERALAAIGRAALILDLGDWVGASRLLGKARIALDQEASVFVRMAYRDVQVQVRLAAGDRQAALAAFQVAESEASRGGFASWGAYFSGVIGVMTGDQVAVEKAMETLGFAGDRGMMARMCLLEATLGGDPAALVIGEREARASHNQFLLLGVLHAIGSKECRVEAGSLARGIADRLEGEMRDRFLALPAVHWAVNGMGHNRESSV